LLFYNFIVYLCHRSASNLNEDINRQIMFEVKSFNLIGETLIYLTLKWVEALAGFYRMYGGFSIRRNVECRYSKT